MLDMIRRPVRRLFLVACLLALPHPPACAGTMPGSTVDPAGAPLADTTVECWMLRSGEWSYAKAVSDAHGGFLLPLEGLETAEEIRIRAGREGCPPRILGADALPADGRRELRIILECPVPEAPPIPDPLPTPQQGPSAPEPAAEPLSPGGEGVVLGIVRDDTMRPLQAVEVILEGGITPLERRTLTDADGAYAFPSVPAHDDYLVTARAPGLYESSAKQARVRPGSTVHLSLLLSRLGTSEIRLRGGFSVRPERPDGKPREEITDAYRLSLSARDFLRWASGTRWKSEDGAHASFPSLEELRPSLPPLRPEAEPIFRAAPEGAPLPRKQAPPPTRPEAPPPPSDAMPVRPPPRALNGSIGDTAGAPVPGALVEAWFRMSTGWGYRTARADSIGAYRLPLDGASPNGEVRLRVSAPGFETTVRAGIDPKAVSEAHDFVLGPSGTAR